MLFTNFSLGIILILGLAPAFMLTLLSRKKVRFLNHRISRYNSDLNAKLSEFLRGVITIRSFGWEKWSLKKYEEGIEYPICTSSIYKKRGFKPPKTIQKKCRKYY